ncbi:translation initiation factor eIF3 core subunit G [Martiniozyma asiatica (nom. inval.)]|nr:translation initiation factor eIF3 core subunit G [Martiniozyma asiatica]
MQSSWAETLPESTSTDNGDGTTTLISYKHSPEGKLIKITQIIKKVTTKSTVNPLIAQRRQWARFGNEKNNETIGPDIKTTQCDEAFKLVLGTAWKKQEEQERQEQKKQLQAKSSTIKCRTCGGEHFTAKCPYKGTLAGQAKKPETTIETQSTPVNINSGDSKYVPPSQRRKAGGLSDSSMVGSGSGAAEGENKSLRVTNLNPQVTEEILRELFAPFNPDRVFLLRDRDTRESRGIAFVDMQTRKGAEAAMDSLDGKGLFNLIVSVDWARPRK